MTTEPENMLERQRLHCRKFRELLGGRTESLLLGRWLDRPQKLLGGTSGLFGTDWPKPDQDVMGDQQRSVSLADNASKCGSVICDATGWSDPTVEPRPVRGPRERNGSSKVPAPVYQELPQWKSALILTRKKALILIFKLKI